MMVIFTDAGEDYDMGSASNTANGATSAGMVAVSVPSDAAYGYHRIRVGARYGTIDPSSCNSGIDGEFEDYSLYVFGSHTYALFMVLISGWFVLFRSKSTKRLRYGKYNLHGFRFFRRLFINS
jgi:hypothetical protein